MIETPSCRDCHTAAWVLRRIGFRDNISWGMLGGPANTVHAFHANSDFAVLHPPVQTVRKDGSTYISEPAITRAGDNPLPLCTRYRSELGWLSAGRSSRLMVYMAHPVAGNYKRNITNAENWLKYLRRRSLNELSEMTGVMYMVKPLILAPWLAAFEMDEEYPGGRDSAIADCKDSVIMFDEIWCMNQVSSGMMAEAGAAKVVRDLTHLGKSPPKKYTKPTNKRRNR